MNRDDTLLTRRRFLEASGIVLFAAAATGCAPASGSRGSGAFKRGGTLQAARSETFDGFKLDAQTANDTYQISEAVIEPLLRFNPNGKGVEPGLAESYHLASDARSITLRLAKAATFSDGRPVTPEDVAFSVDLWKSGPNYGLIYKFITAVKTIDHRTVRFEFSSPNSSVDAFLTWSIAGVVPKDFGGKTESDYWQQPVGSGPFKVQSWDPAGDVVLVRNPHYHIKGRPYLDKVINSLTSDPNQRRLQIVSTQVDTVEEIAPEQAALYPANLRIESLTHFTDTLLPNTRRKPFDDVRVRKAMALAIDYDAIVNGLYKGLAEPPTGFLPPNVGLWVPPSKPYFKRDRAAARELLSQAGATGTSFELVYPSESGFDDLAQVVQSSLQSVGMNAKLLAVETGTFLDETYGAKFDVALWSYNAISPDIADPVEFILSTSYFFTGYSARRTEALLNRYYAATDESAKRVMVREIQDLGSNEAPFLALDHYHITTAVQSYVHGVKPAPWSSYYYDVVWKN